MSPNEPESLPSALALLFERLVSGFKAAWLAGQAPVIDPLLRGAPEALRPALLRELIRLDVHYRRGAGEAPRLLDYQHLPALDLTWLETLLSAGDTPASDAPATASESLQEITTPQDIEAEGP